MSKKKTLVVIGNGMVGQYFFATLMDSPLKDNFEVVTFCEERIAAYDRIHLSEYFSGKTADDLSLVEEVFFENKAITIHMGGKATSIDNELKTVTSEKGVVVSYDKLVIATGCTAFVQPITGLSNFERTWDLEQDVVKSDKSLISRAATSSKGSEYS